MIVYLFVPWHRTLVVFKQNEYSNSENKTKWCSLAGIKIRIFYNDTFYFHAKAKGNNYTKDKLKHKYSSIN